MELNFNSQTPIFQQIADGIEEAVLTGAFPEESQIPSITEFSVRYTINPATALKGINLLVEEGVLYKRRGVGMFVSPGAAELLQEKRRAQFARRFITPAAAEAKRLGLSEEELLTMLQAEYRKGDKP